MNEINLPKHWIPVNLLGAAHHYTQAAHQYAEAYAIAAVEKDRAERVSVPDGWMEFVERLSKQKPEKPDYWSSCGQCEHNIADAEELLAAAPQPQPVQEQPTNCRHCGGNYNVLCAGQCKQATKQKED